MPNGRPEGVKSSERTLDVLELLAQSPQPLSFSEIGRALAIPKSSLHKLLATLENRGWVDTDDLTRTRYRVGLRALQAGTSFVDGDGVVNLVEPVLSTLTEQFGEASHLGRLDRGDVVYLAKRESPHPLRMFSAVGRRIPAHASAMGKALLAQLPWDEVTARVGPRPARLTERTIATLDQLRDELAVTRERGFGVDDEESAEMMRAVAVAVPTRGDTLNAVSVSAPSLRLPSESIQEVAVAIAQAIAAIAPSPARVSAGHGPTDTP